MTHLRIEQNNIPETVNGATIKSLYNTIKDMNLSNVQLSGNLQTSTASEKAVNYLNGEVSTGVKRFPNLNITAQKLYIDFEDPVVEALVVATNAAQGWHKNSALVGDGIGITKAEAADIKSFSDMYTQSPFNGNNQIKKFNEFVYFTGLIFDNGYSRDNNTRLFQNSSIEEIDLSNLTTVGMETFQNCANLTKIGNTDKITYLGDYTFYGCTNLHVDVNFPSLETLGKNPSSANGSMTFSNAGIVSITSLGNIKIIPSFNNYNAGAFANCTSLINIDLHTTTQLEQINRCAFANCTACETVHLPSSITSIADYAFQRATSLRWIKIDATTPPTITTATFTNANTTFKIYVPDATVSDYKSSTWSNFSSRIFPISQFATDFPNG